MTTNAYCWNELEFSEARQNSADKEYLYCRKHVQRSEIDKKTLFRTMQPSLGIRLIDQQEPHEVSG